MIGFLKGKVKTVLPTRIILDVHDVGYLIETGSIGIKVGEELELFIHTHVRDQEMSLYGFKTEKDINIFESLLTVSGVGPKSALALITEKGSDSIIMGVNRGDTLGLRAKGIGQKTIEKIIVELKDKFSNYTISSTSKDGGVSIDKEVYLDVVEALSSLGYRKLEIDLTLKEIDITDKSSAEVVIKQVLSLLRR
jgi:holliday junction DNA helicase RuvA